MWHFLKFYYLVSLCLSNMPSSVCRFSLSIVVQTEPKSYVEASMRDCWNQTRQVELASIEGTDIWKLLNHPSHIKPMGCGWT